MKEQEVTGAASSIQRHHKLAQLQKEIDYYELGDTISRKDIQVKLAEIEGIQEEINRLTAVVEEKRRTLLTHVFGEQTIIQ
ncbi:hypothetical protein [Sporosarcina pasteurii]|uniref:Uncharacterized protein n=1 Tax=Sporosarcina pasteurii TaxID=1474 RepID=A0A380C1J2_SPOPA|nr:hypothetical protein [Sporosarcina pasteurii]MDS9471437.1 hypothetical protein [Sporosarcina pasteurii]QBQ04940.1 hypothetical protein E2C16_04320 [Sporosarcina pasteurii]SUJ09902.1 Uncharacterised protein [Sporosarcina pasteurii]